MGYGLLIKYLNVSHLFEHNVIMLIDNDANRF